MKEEFKKVSRFLKHPIHPIAVHLPLALWPAALLFDLLSRADVGGNAMVQLSFWAIALGLIATLIAIPTGIADWWGIKKENPARKVGLYHMGLNGLVTVLYVLNLIFRLKTFRYDTEVAPLPLVFSMIGTVVLIGSAYLGGLMVYDYGIGVARHSKEKWREVAEAAGANVPPKEEK
jgi:uncharacterized membrane protein